MIQWLEDPSALTPEQVGGSPCMSVNIRCGLRAGGPGLKRDFWVQRGPDGAPQGWIMENGGHIWASLANPAHQDAALEMADFLAAKGFEWLECDEIVAAALGGPDRLCPVLFCPHPPQASLPGGVEVTEGSVAELTSLLLEAGELDPAGRDAFYAARHLFFRRGCEKILLIRRHGRAAACGVLAYPGGGEAAITCVATLPQDRGTGMGSALVLAMARLAASEGHTSVLCCNENLLPFYIRLGFRIHNYCAQLWRTAEAVEL